MTLGRHTWVIIVNYLNWQDTLECAMSLLESTVRNFTIVVVDNGSGNHSIENLRQALEQKCSVSIIGSEELISLSVLSNPPRIFLVQHSHNAGFAAANNLVISSLRSQDGWVWLLNPDMIVLPDTMQQLIAFTDQQKELTVTGSLVKSWQDKNKTIMYGGGKVNWNTATVTEVVTAAGTANLDYISGASLFCHLSCFSVVGLLPEEYFLVWEETDWCQRAKQAGIHLAVCSEAVCYDKISTVIGKGFLAQYYYTRNGLFFIRRYKKDKMNRVLFAALLRFIRRVVTGQWKQAGGVWKGISDFRKNKLHALE